MKLKIEGEKIVVEPYTNQQADIIRQLAENGNTVEIKPITCRSTN